MTGGSGDADAGSVFFFFGKGMSDHIPKGLGEGQI